MRLPRVIRCRFGKEAELVCAVREGKREKAISLLESGADTTISSADGTPLLLTAVLSGNHDIVEALLKRSVDVNASNRSGMTPLKAAIMARDLELVAILLEADANLPEELSAQTLCIPAVVNARVLAQLLLNATSDGAAIHRIQTQCALVQASLQGHSVEVRQLIERGAELNAGHPVEWGVDFRLPVEFTPLMAAAVSGHIETVRTLLRLGADPNVASVSNGMTALHWASNHREGMEADVLQQIVDELVSHGAEIDKENVFGMTPLHSAVCSNRALAVAALIKSGADVNKSTGSGFVPLHLAAAHGHPEVAELLIAGRADIEAKDEESLQTPLIWTTDRRLFVLLEGHFRVAKLLLNAGANVNAKGADGNTPLMKIAGTRRYVPGLSADIFSPTTFAKMLLSMGADPEAKTPEGWSAFDIAQVTSGNEEIADLLRPGT